MGIWLSRMSRVNVWVKKIVPSVICISWWLESILVRRLTLSMLKYRVEFSDDGISAGVSQIVSVKLSLLFCIDFNTSVTLHSFTMIYTVILWVRILVVSVVVVISFDLLPVLVEVYLETTIDWVSISCMCGGSGKLVDLLALYVLVGLLVLMGGDRGRVTSFILHVPCSSDPTQ